MSLIYIQSKNELQELLIDNKYVIAIASATFCGPCKRFAPVVEEIAKEMTNITIAKVEVDKIPSTNDILGVGSVPTIIFYKDSKEIHREIGALNKEDLKNIIKEKLT